MLVLGGVLNGVLWGLFGLDLSNEVLSGEITWMSTQDVWIFVLIKFGIWSLLLVILHRLFLRAEISGN